MPDRLQLVMIPDRDEVALARDVVTHTASYQAGNSPEEMADLRRWAWSTLRIDRDLRTGRIELAFTPGDAA